MTTLAIIHTTTATVESLKALAAEILPDVTVINFVDDSILPQLARNGGALNEVQERLVAYARFAEQAGANIILEACSSVGEAVPALRAAVSIPVVRIDEAMAEAAIQRGTRLGVAATLATTLQPTTRLLHARALAAGMQLDIHPTLIEGAFEKLAAGDRDGHDALVAESLLALASAADVVVLAQASMARVVPRLPDALQPKFLSSPRLGMASVKTVLASLIERQTV